MNVLETPVYHLQKRVTVSVCKMKREMIQGSIAVAQPTRKKLLFQGSAVTLLRTGAYEFPEYIRRAYK